VNEGIALLKSIDEKLGQLAASGVAVQAPAVRPTGTRQGVSSIFGILRTPIIDKHRGDSRPAGSREEIAGSMRLARLAETFPAIN
jgi:hypothetical protein